MAAAGATLFGFFASSKPSEKCSGKRKEPEAPLPCPVRGCKYKACAANSTAAADLDEHLAGVHPKSQVGRDAKRRLLEQQQGQQRAEAVKDGQSEGTVVLPQRRGRGSKVPSAKSRAKQQNDAVARPLTVEQVREDVERFIAQHCLSPEIAAQLRQENEVVFAEDPGVDAARMPVDERAFRSGAGEEGNSRVSEDSCGTEPLAPPSPAEQDPDPVQASRVAACAYTQGSARPKACTPAPASTATTVPQQATPVPTSLVGPRLDDTGVQALATATSPVLLLPGPVQIADAFSSTHCTSTTSSQVPVEARGLTTGTQESALSGAKPGFVQTGGGMAIPLVGSMTAAGQPRAAVPLSQASDVASCSRLLSQDSAGSCTGGWSPVAQRAENDDASVKAPGALHAARGGWSPHALFARSMRSRAEESNSADCEDFSDSDFLAACHDMEARVAGAATPTRTRSSDLQASDGCNMGAATGDANLDDMDIFAACRVMEASMDSVAATSQVWSPSTDGLTSNLGDVAAATAFRHERTSRSTAAAERNWRLR